MMDCPECTQVMTQVPVEKPRSYTACIQWEKYRCEPCKLIAKVETIFEHEEPVSIGEAHER
jgi:hypothetical protein